MQPPFWIFVASTEDLLKNELPARLKRFGYSIQSVTGDYLYAPGTLPVMLVAHVDTVRDYLERWTKPEILYDPKKRVLWSPDGLGADDRAGIAAVFEIIEMGYRPHVLFTNYEELGCVGASSAVLSLDPPNVRYILELDRRGWTDAVFYSCTNTEFIDYVLSFGFEEEHGTFSDICVLCSEWGIAGTNLSVGYYNEHMTTEHLRLEHLEDTVRKVARMLDNVPSTAFQYLSAVTKMFGTADRSGYYREDCDDPAQDWEDYLEAKYGEANVRKMQPHRLLPSRTSQVSMSRRTSVWIGVTASQFASHYGGTEEFWAQWLDEHSDIIERLCRDGIFDVIERSGLVIPEVIDPMKSETDDLQFTNGAVKVQIVIDWPDGVSMSGSAWWDPGTGIIFDIGEVFLDLVSEKIANGTPTREYILLPSGEDIDICYDADLDCYVVESDTDAC